MCHVLLTFWIFLQEKSLAFAAEGVRILFMNIIMSHCPSTEWSIPLCYLPSRSQYLNTTLKSQLRLQYLKWYVNRCTTGLKHAPHFLDKLKLVLGLQHSHYTSPAMQIYTAVFVARCAAICESWKYFCSNIFLNRNQVRNGLVLLQIRHDSMMSATSSNGVKGGKK